MPKTQGSGNPVWTRDETLLALDLLYRHGKPIDRTHADVMELSRLLQSADIYPAEGRRANFRNPDGVALKLQNLLSAIVPNRGLSYSRMDERVVDEFPESRKSHLAALANSLRLAVLAGENEIVPDDDEPEFLEGRILTRRHRQRERNPRLRTKLLEARRPQGLRCEICESGISSTASPAAESFFEAHHNVPLATAEGETKTKLSDMALVCACCHRFIHRLIASEKRWVGIEEAAQRRREIVFEAPPVERHDHGRLRQAQA